MSEPDGSADEHGDAQDALWQALSAEAEHGPELYAHLFAGRKPHLTDVADLMLHEPEPPAMVPGAEDWLVLGELHWIFADPEAGKTWLALRLAIDVVEAGGRVVYFDEELGGPVIAERLLALGADPETMQGRFAFSPFPSWQMEQEDAESHRDFLAAFRPSLVIYDTCTDMLSEADLDENSGIDVTKWVKAYPEEARKVGAAQLVLDHVGHVAKGRAVGSRAKRSKAKVAYGMKAVDYYDTATRGKIEIALAKNTRGAHLPRLRRFAVGGTPFSWEPVAVASRLADDSDGRRVVQDVIPLEESEAKSVRQIAADCELTRSTVEGHLAVLEADGTVLWKPGPRNAHLYWVNFQGDVS